MQIKRICLTLIVVMAFPLASSAAQKPAPELTNAIFAGGCFWCMESPYDKLEGVTATISGYIGGRAENAHYKKISAGLTRHVEAIQITYDPEKVSYQQLLDVFWKNVDPFDSRGQFCDKGPQYLSYIYYASESERMLAEASLKKVAEGFDRNVATKIAASSTFYPAEAYHQNYYQRNPIRYRFYRSRCGRDDRLEELWGAQ